MKIAKCYDCGQKTEVEWCYNAYMQEIYPETLGITEKKHNYCKDCLNEQYMDT